MSAANPRTNRPGGGLTRFEHLVHGVAAIGFVIQAATGFGSLLATGANRGWALFVHMFGAGVFITGLTVSTLLWAHRCRFDAAPAGARRLTAGQKLMFWVYTTLGLAVMVPVLAAMLPLFGTPAQETLVGSHMIAALLLTVAMLVHTVVSLAARRARRTLP